MDTWLDVCDAVIITHSHRRAAARPKPKPKAKSKEKGGFFMTQSSSSSPEVRKSKKSLSPCRLPEELTAVGQLFVLLIFSSNECIFVFPGCVVSIAYEIECCASGYN